MRDSSDVDELATATARTRLDAAGVRYRLVTDPRQALDHARRL